MTWVYLGLVAALLICVLLAIATGRRRTAHLREEFGPEYDRTLRAHRDQHAAEAELRRRWERHRRLDIRPLDPAAREEHAQRWDEVQRRFATEPAPAVAEADGLIAEVMRARGYPVEDFEQRAAAMSVDHPETVEHYRAAHAISVASAAGAGRTEDLRRAMAHFRALFDELLHDEAHGTVRRDVHERELT
jgi:hypothetical protein